MDRLNLFKYQFQTTHTTTMGMVEDVDDVFWYSVPDGLNTNIAWLVGHIILGRYEHMLVASGLHKELHVEKLSIMKNSELFETGSKALMRAESLSKQDLLEDLVLSYDLVMSIFNSANDSSLDELPFGEFSMAETKGASFSWAVQHEMWHVGQISLLRKVLEISSDFKWVKRLNEIWRINTVK